MLLMACGPGGDRQAAEELYTAGKRAFAGQDLAAAAELFSRARKADPAYAGAAIMLGKTHFYLGQFEEALSVFQDLHELHPGNAAAHYWLGKLYLNQGDRLEEAERHLGRAIELDDNHFNARFYMAKIMEKRQKLGEALRHYEQARVIKRDFDKIHAGIGRIYLRLGSPERAKQEFAQMQRPDAGLLATQEEAEGEEP